MAMNGLEKWASSNGAEPSINGRKDDGDNIEGVAMKVMTSSNVGNESTLAQAASSTVSYFSSSRADGTDSLSHVHLSASAHVIPVTSNLGQNDESTQDTSKTRRRNPVDGDDEPISQQKPTAAVGTKSPDMSIRKKRTNVPSAIATASCADVVNQSPARHRKSAFSARSTTVSSANASPAATTPSTPVGGNGAGGHRFKFPTVKMGGFLFRKKCSWPTLNYASMAANSGSGGSGTSGDRSPSPTSHEQQKLKKYKGAKSVDVDNDSPRRQSAKFYNNVGSASGAGAGAGNVAETSPLLKRINNRLQLDRSKRYSTATNYHSRHSCYCMNAENHCDCFHRHGSAKRCTSKEDPGPRTEANNMAAMNDVMASLMVEEMADSSCAGTSGACNKSASYPTAFAAGGLFGQELGANTWNSGAKYKLVKEGQIQVCRLNHPRTVLGKLTSSKLLRRWETHTLILESDEIKSKTVSFCGQPTKLQQEQSSVFFMLWQCHCNS